MDHLHRNILKRIFWAWLFISTCALTSISLLGIRRFDKLATQMATTEANRLLLSTTGVGGLEAISIQNPQKADPEHILSGLRKLRIYDSRGILILERNDSTLQKERTDLELNLKAFPRDGRPHLHHFTLAQETYLQWLIPVRNARNPRVGYIEGVLLLNENDVWVLTTSIKVGVMAVFLSITVTALALYPLMLSLSHNLIHFSDDIAKGHVEILSVLGAAIAQRDSDTGDHNFRVTLYAIRLAEALGTNDMDMRVLILGSLLHDVGKIGIRDDILLKPGPLNEQEIAAMRSHVQKGLEIVSFSRWLYPSVDVIHYHHEHYDGSGYPQGKTREAIPPPARLFAIVDVFDALTSTRPYKEPWPIDRALEYLQKRSGTQFDPTILQTFEGIARKTFEEAHGKSASELLAILMRAAEPYHELSPHEHGARGRKGWIHPPEAGPAGTRLRNVDG